MLYFAKMVLNWMKLDVFVLATSSATQNKKKMKKHALVNPSLTKNSLSVNFNAQKVQS